MSPHLPIFLIRSPYPPITPSLFSAPYPSHLTPHDLCVFFGGIPEKAVKKAFVDADIYVSPALLQEYRDVPLALEAEGKLTHNQLKALISGLATFVTKTIVVHPREKISVC